MPEQRGPRISHEERQQQADRDEFSRLFGEFGTLLYWTFVMGPEENASPSQVDDKWRHFGAKFVIWIER